MKIIGLLAPGWNTAQDWIEKNFGYTDAKVSLSPSNTVTFGSTLQIRYITNLNMARGYEFISLIKLPGWGSKWSEQDYITLETRVRPQKVEENWKNAYKTAEEHSKQLKAELEEYKLLHEADSKDIQMLREEVQILRNNLDSERFEIKELEAKIIKLFRKNG